MNRKVSAIILALIAHLSAWAINFTELDTTRNDYFVVLNGEGYGTSWDDAMGNAEFSYLLGHVKCGATFHVAAGLYTPILDSKYEIASTGTSKRYNITRPVNIIGGYSPSPVKGEVANSKINKTIFSADCEGDNIEGNFKENRDNDCFNCLSIDISKYKTSTVSIFGIQFEGGYTYFGPYSRNWNANCSIGGSTVNFENCTFTDSYNALSYTHSSVYFTNCTFRGNQRVFLWTVGDVSISNSLFANNDYISIGASASYAEGSQDENKTRHVNILNNSFKENGSIVISGKRSSYLNGYNNTIISSEGALELNSSETTMTLVGNIFCVQSISFKDTCDKNFTSRYNLYQAKDPEFSTPISSSDILDKGMETIVNNELEGHSYDSDYLRLLNKELSDGTPLTFPLSETILKEDQRHVKRNDPTCIGSFEIDGNGHMPRHRYSGLDTLTSGDKYASIDQTFTTGYYPDVPEVFKNSKGEDSLIIHHQLYVKPSVHQETFYVKLGGNGDGSSWEKAMSDTAFSIVLTHAKNHISIHLAEGVYHPMFYENGEINDESFSSYGKIGKYALFSTSNQKISITGGYSKDIIDEEELPNPYLFETIISGDLNEDDTVSKNKEDNAENCFKYKPILNGAITISGITFKGSANHGAGGALFKCEQHQYDIKNEFTDINFYLCRFLSNENAISIGRNGYTNIKECQILGQLNIYECNNFVMDKSSLSNPFGSTYINARTVQITNSTILRDTTSWYSFQIGRFFDNEYADISLKHNTILSDIEFNPSKIHSHANIFGGNVKISIWGQDSLSSQMNVTHNIFVEGVLDSLTKKGQIGVTDSNIVLTESELFEILRSKDGEFLLEKDDDSFTPTVAILKDSLDDGRSLLTKRTGDDINLKYDQRGKERREMTSIGAYDNISKTITREVEIEIPTIFTPNGNGKNDIFMPDHELYIYNIYGQMICHSTNGWDGYYQGRLAPYGVYIYVTFLGSGEIKKGTIEMTDIEK